MFREVLPRAFTVSPSISKEVSSNDPEFIFTLSGMSSAMFSTFSALLDSDYLVSPVCEHFSTSSINLE
jgi:hypothetical protein